jgi:GTPase SAR1 family protein
MSNNLPKDPHCALICGQTGCGKTEFVLNLIQGHYLENFKHIIILCPTIDDNKTYANRLWIELDSKVITLDPEDRLQDCLRYFHDKLKNNATLFIIDDCSATKALKEKHEALSELAFSGRHTQHSVWILTQKYNSVSKDFREQTRWVALFHCKDKDSFEECLRENDVIPSKNERDDVKQQLKQNKYSKVILKTDQLCDYKVEN